MIRGKRLPESFRVVLQLPQDQAERFCLELGEKEQDAPGLYLNIRYEDGTLYCVTGISLKVFTLDKTLEQEWDRRAEEMMRQMKIAHM